MRHPCQYRYTFDFIFLQTIYIYSIKNFSESSYHFNIPTDHGIFSPFFPTAHHCQPKLNRSV